MSQHREEHLELCAGYALGCLDDGDRRALEAHLAEGCAVCEVELLRLGETASAMAESAPSLRAPAALKRRVMAAVRAEPNAGAARAAESRGGILPLPAPRRPALLTWGFAAAAAVLAVIGALEWRALQDLRRDLDARRNDVAELRRQLEDERRWTDVPAAPHAVAVNLAPTPDGSPQLTARVTYDPETHRALVVCSNFGAPTGKDYQLWAIMKSGPSSLGLVRADESGHAVIRLRDVGDPAQLTAFAVSLEKEGGAPTPYAPAGAVVMLGKIGG